MSNKTTNWDFFNVFGFIAIAILLFYSVGIRVKDAKETKKVDPVELKEVIEFGYNEKDYKVLIARTADGQYVAVPLPEN